MPISSERRARQPAALTAEDQSVGHLVASLVGRRVARVDRIGGGRNSRVYRIDCGAPPRYAAKRYFAPTAVERRRLENEFAGLTFLWRHGIRAVPRPLAADAAAGCAVYEYVEGTPISSHQVGERDIDDAADFLARLKALTHRRDSRRLPVASEACFSIRTIGANLELRLSRLRATDARGPEYRQLHAFLDRELEPAADDIMRWCRSRLRGSGLGVTASLARGKRTLSPSDFGFHNAVRRPDGTIAFVDFEYFGWDDPAKMVADFLLHPAMRLRRPLGRRFVERIVDRFDDDPSLGQRIELVWPLFGLKWCLILLNEFVPMDLERRRFAAGHSADAVAVQRRQLAKARRMLGVVLRGYGNFPYRD